MSKDGKAISVNKLTATNALRQHILMNLDKNGWNNLLEDIKRDADYFFNPAVIEYTNEQLEELFELACDSLYDQVGEYLYEFIDVAELTNLSYNEGYYYVEVYAITMWNGDIVLFDYECAGGKHGGDGLNEDWLGTARYAKFRQEMQLVNIYETDDGQED